MSKKSLDGTCAICKSKVTKTGMKKHLQSCLQKNADGEKAVVRTKPPVKLFHLLMEGYGLSEDLYWMHLTALGSASFRDLDNFLRKTWLECCGHMSAFRSGRSKVSMNWKLEEFLEPGLRLLYEYDFGSTTELLLTVVSKFEGSIKKGKVEILARNEAPRVKCNQCGEPATTICPECLYDDKGWLCNECAELHECDLGVFLPLVNSPRTGVCGYEG